MERLRFLRETKTKLTQEDFAKIIHMSRQNYNFYENGKREPDIKTLIEIASYYNVSIDYLIGYTDTPAPLKTEFSFEEQQIIKKYRALDERGKNNVLQTLDNEYQYVEEYSQKKKQA